MITNSYREIPDIPYGDLPVIHYMWHTSHYPSIMTHWHHDMELLYILEGSLYISCGSFSGVASAGDIVIINPHQLHVATSGDTDVKYHVVLFNLDMLYGNETSDIAARFINPVAQNKIQFYNIIQDKAIADIIQDIVSENQSKLPGYELKLKASLLLILSTLTRYHTLPADQISMLDYGFKEVLDYINENYSSANLSTDEIARHFSFNKSYFCRKFKKQTGMPFIDYLNYKRLETANILIHKTEKSITEIALSVGFNDLNYFSRKFFELYGLRPKEIRKGMVRE